MIILYVLIFNSNLIPGRHYLLRYDILKAQSGIFQLPPAFHLEAWHFLAFVKLNLAALRYFSSIKISVKAAETERITGLLPV